MGIACKSSDSDSFSNSQLENQLKEEKAKAVKIIEDNCWESKFEEAEKYAFFNGTIRFLYLNGATVAWDDFDDKFSRAKVLFNDNNIVPTSTITLLLKQFSEFEKIKDKYLFTSVGYHARHKCWKKDILCSEDPDVTQAVHSLLMDSPSPTFEAEYQSFINSGLIDKIILKDENYKYRYHWHYYWAIHKDYSQNEGVYVSASHKNKCKILKNLSDAGRIVIVDPGFNSYHSGYYWGIRTIFKYNGTPYSWHVSYDNSVETDKIYKYENDQDSSNGVTWISGADLPLTIDGFRSWN